jgi:hypothetical protein
VMISILEGSFGIGACLGVNLGPHGCASCPVEMGAAPLPARVASEIQKAARLLAEAAQAPDPMPQPLRVRLDADATKLRTMRDKRLRRGGSPPKPA